MGQHDFSQLFGEYPNVIAAMPTDFTAHAFILELARRHQRLYIEALYTYRNGSAPFQAVHQQLAMMLNECPNLVRRNGDEPNSQDIWTNQQGCSRWQKVR